MIQINPLTFFRKRTTWFRTTRKRNKVIVIASIIILFFILLNGIQNANSQPNYVTTVVKKADVVQVVSETGNINVAGRADVSSTTTGIIEEIFVNNDMQIETGQELFSVRSTATDNEKAAAYASYQSALSSKKTADQGTQSNDALMWSKQEAFLNAKNAKEYKDTHTQNPATGNAYTDLEKQSIDAAFVQAEKDFRSAEQKYKDTGISITAANAQVNSAWLSYLATQNSVVKAPTSGTIANLSVSVGDKVSAGGSQIPSSSLSTASLTSASSQPVLTIANISRNFTVKVSLNEADIPKIRRGQKVKIDIDALNDKTFDGIVNHVDSIGTENAGVVTYNIAISIQGLDEDIRPGMTAGVEIQVDEKKNVLTVPNSAVKPYKGSRAVRIYDKKTNGIKFVPINTGIKGDDRTEIISGLKEGQEIIVSLPNEQIKRPGLF